MTDQTQAPTAATRLRAFWASLWPIVKATAFALMLPFNFIGVLCLMGNFSVEDLRSIGTSMVVADDASIASAFYNLKAMYIGLVFLILCVFIAVGGFGPAVNEPADRVRLRLMQLVPGQYSDSTKHTAVMAVLCVLLVGVLIMMGVGTTPGQAPPSLRANSQAAVKETWAAVIQPDGTILRGTAKVTHAPGAQTYQVELTAQRE
ncbi:MAG: hypothetical protein ACOZE7_04540 [Pseudomonadota bacterium]